MPLIRPITRIFLSLITLYLGHYVIQDTVTITNYHFSQHFYYYATLLLTLHNILTLHKSSINYYALILS